MGVYENYRVREISKIQKIRNFIIFNSYFNFFLIVTISTNFILIGFSLEYESSIVEILNYSINSIYLIEILLKLYVFKFIYFRTFWNLIDFLSAISSFWFLINRTENREILFLILLRNFRIISSIPKIKFIFELFVNSVFVLSYTLSVFLLLSVVGSLIIVSNILPGNSSIEFRYLFGSVPAGFLTILQCITLDNWHRTVARPLATSGHWLPVVTVLLIVLVGYYAYGNILLGWYVDRAVAISLDEDERFRQERDSKEEERLRGVIGGLHDGLPTDRKDIDEESLVGIEKNLIDLGIDSNDLSGMFKIMDADGLGYISVAQVCQGLSRIRGDAKGRDLVHLKSILKKCSDKVNVLHGDFELVQNSINSISNNLEEFSKLISNYKNLNETKILNFRENLEKFKNRQKNLNKTKH
jgi:voltage-gated sodium channel